MSYSYCVQWGHRWLAVLATGMPLLISCLSIGSWLITWLITYYLAIIRYMVITKSNLALQECVPVCFCCVVMQEPFLAVVVDPVRTMASGKVGNASRLQGMSMCPCTPCSTYA